jgi:cytochrome d ubiquinol oxidase subunit I
MLDLSRLQFFVTAAFHMTFPALTVGLSILMVILYAAYLKTGNDAYLRMFRFWRKIFAVGFGLGVVAGIVMTFEFGLNWGQYAHAVGPIIGVIIGMEVVTAFCLEAAFLGVVLYGENRVGKKMMLFSTVMVSLGTLLSTTWILSANSWMQTPAGYEEVGGQFRRTDWLDVLLNPAFGWRFPHMLVAVLISSAAVVAAIGAYYLRRGRHLDFARRTVSTGLLALLILVPVQLHVGDGVGGFMAKNQPAKMVALEGHWSKAETRHDGAWNLLIWPNEKEQRNEFELALPWFGSMVAGKDLTGKTNIPGIKDLPPDLPKPAMIWPFYGFRVMAFSAYTLLATALLALVLRIRGRLYSSRRFLRWVTWVGPLGICAIIGGWVTAETGRQPWVVFGKLATAQAVSPLGTGTVAASLAAFVVVYAALLGIFIAAVRRIVRQGPEEAEQVVEWKADTAAVRTPLTEG